MLQHNGLQPFLVGKQNVLTDFLLAQKKMVGLEPPGLVVMDRNASTVSQDQKEVPLPLQHIFHVLFSNNGVVLSPKLPVPSNYHEGLLEFYPSVETNNNDPHQPHSLQQQKPY
jgi:hypothetical protein